MCVLDTGVTQAHPLLAPALKPNDVHSYDPGWPGGDSRGHGTNMAGIALLGDLMPLLAGNGVVPLTHRLESVKILPDQGENEPRLYGAITRESIARAEVQAPSRHRAVCMAVDPTYAGWQPIAPVGDLSPTSRTSVTWEKKWPIKPDVVLEGGNWAALDDQCDCPDDLGLLTTYRDPTTRHFDIFRDTSAATAMAGNLAGRILAAAPDRWPETIRTLIVHSAEWTPAMRQQFESATSEQQKRVVLQKYGYGVPSYERAIFSTLNDLTLVEEDELQPLWKDNKDGAIKSGYMNLHQFPWPLTELEQLAETEVELRVTLSYYVEPNPGERGWLVGTATLRTAFDSPSRNRWSPRTLFASALTPPW